MIKAILFDMDGVLINARDWHYDALNRALSHFGYTISRESHVSTFDGLPTRRKLEILSMTHQLPCGLHDIINRLKQQYTLEISYQCCRPTFNHKYALSRLKREGFKIAVCSNSIRPTIDAMMQLSNLRSHLDEIISNQDVLNSKPDPEMYVMAMSRLNVIPSDCIIVEDNDHGVQAAIASGGHLLRVADPSDVTYKLIRSRIDGLEG